MTLEDARETCELLAKSLAACGDWEAQRDAAALRTVLAALPTREQEPDRAYPQIQVGDVIEFAHGDDPPMFQRLSHPAAVEDWNGKLRNRVRGVYRPIAEPSTPPEHKE